MTEDIKPVVLGPSERNAWRVSGGQADLVRQPAPAMPARLQAEPKDCVIDLARTSDCALHSVFRDFVKEHALDGRAAFAPDLACHMPCRAGHVR